MKRIVIVMSIMAVMATLRLPAAWGCTSVIISGKATADGRPLIFKNRDTGTLENLMAVCQGERYRYVGLLNAGDTMPENVWGGHNEAGFAIINTAAFNLNGDEGDTDGDGILIRKALSLCASVEDFETLLDTVAKPMQVNSNFGVIDAHGCCAYYETGHYKYVKFDANDPAVAPDGYLVRTNFGTTGNHRLDEGVERFHAISAYMEQAEAEGPFEACRLVASIPRHFTHGLTKWDLRDFMPGSAEDTQMFPIGDYITRYSTASAILVQGVLPGERPQNTVSWVVIGSPMTAVVLPTLLLRSGRLPQAVADDGTGHSPLNTRALKLKEQIFPLKSGNTKAYIDLAKLMNHANTGILQRLMPVERELTERGKAAIDRMRSGEGDSAVEQYYDWADEFVSIKYHELFGL